MPESHDPTRRMPYSQPSRRTAPAPPPRSAAGDPFVVGHLEPLDIETELDRPYGEPASPAWPRPHLHIDRARLARPAALLGAAALVGVGIWSATWSTPTAPEPPTTAHTAATASAAASSGERASHSPARAMPRLQRASGDPVIPPRRPTAAGTRRAAADHRRGDAEGRRGSRPRSTATADAATPTPKPRTSRRPPANAVRKPPPRRRPAQPPATARRDPAPAVPAQRRPSLIDRRCDELFPPHRPEFAARNAACHHLYGTR
ncbi:hypothetical protein SAMN05421505_1555 [Sinosporangium album]|uniref:Uncharacterized protein n=1 Tax=Sinosporangium album TaxID=504805 RepID=A0A1G8KTJ5_9ACTN|nr:hypothetical protein [Sinosporangium album]SDI46758.1 hypothetical protein SAMN05421505_1555 [Sinosporangium album]